MKCEARLQQANETYIEHFLCNQFLASARSCGCNGEHFLELAKQEYVSLLYQRSELESYAEQLEEARAGSPGCSHYASAYMTLCGMYDKLLTTLCHQYPIFQSLLVECTT